MGLPIHVYPLYENSRRAHRGQSAGQNDMESATMYAAFDRIGSENEYSWNYGQPAKTAEQISVPSGKNRMICDPCEFCITSQLALFGLSLGVNEPVLTSGQIPCS